MKIRSVENHISLPLCALLFSLLSPLSFPPNPHISKLWAQTENKPYKITTDENGNEVWVDEEKGWKIIFSYPIEKDLYISKYDEYNAKTMIDLFKDLGDYVDIGVKTDLVSYTTLKDPTKYKPGVYKGFDQAGVFIGLDILPFNIEYFYVRGPAAFVDAVSGVNESPVRKISPPDIWLSKSRLEKFVIKLMNNEEIKDDELKIMKVDNVRKTVGEDLIKQLETYQKAIKEWKPQTYSDEDITVEYIPILPLKRIVNQKYDEIYSKYEEQIWALIYYRRYVSWFMFIYEKASDQQRERIRQVVMNGMSYEEYIEKIKPKLRKVNGKYTFIHPDINGKTFITLVIFGNAIIHLLFPKNDGELKLAANMLLGMGFSKSDLASFGALLKFNIVSVLGGSDNSEVRETIRDEFYIRGEIEDYEIPGYIFSLIRDGSIFNEVPYTELIDLEGTGYMLGYTYFGIPFFSNLEIASTDPQGITTFLLDKKRGVYIPIERIGLPFIDHKSQIDKYSNSYVLLKITDNKTGKTFYTLSTKIVNKYKGGMSVMNYYLPPETDFPYVTPVTEIWTTGLDPDGFDHILGGVVALKPRKYPMYVQFGPLFYIDNLTLHIGNKNISLNSGLLSSMVWNVNEERLKRIYSIPIALPKTIAANNVSDEKATAR